MNSNLDHSRLIQSRYHIFSRYHFLDLLFFISEYLSVTMRKPWNPLGPLEQKSWVRWSVEFKNIEDEECRKILSLSGSKLFKYVEYVTSSSPINRSFGFYYLVLCRIKSKNNSDAEAMVKTIRSILLCIRSRLLGKRQNDCTSENMPNLDGMPRHIKGMTVYSIDYIV